MRFLFVDRILDINPGKNIRGLKHVSYDDFYLMGSPDGRLQFPTSLIGETLGQLAAWNVMQYNGFSHRPVAGIVSKVSFTRGVFPGETLWLESSIDSLDEASVSYHSTAYVDEREIFNIEGALGPMLPMQDLISADKARHQFNEIYQTGDASSEQHPNLFPDAEIRLPRFEFIFDQVIDMVPGQSISAIKRITRAAPWFPDHFPNKPVLPLTVLLECKLNLARQFLKHSNFDAEYEPFELRRIKMNEFVMPGDLVKSYLKIKQHDEHKLTLSCRSEVNDKRVCVLEILLARREK